MLFWLFSSTLGSFRKIGFTFIFYLIIGLTAWLLYLWLYFWVYSSSILLVKGRLLNRLTITEHIWLLTGEEYISSIFFESYRPWKPILIFFYSLLISQRRSFIILVACFFMLKLLSYCVLIAIYRLTGFGIEFFRLHLPFEMEILLNYRFSENIIDAWDLIATLLSLVLAIFSIYYANPVLT